MQGLPLHPAIVHIPVGLATILPLVSLGLAVAIALKKIDRKAWAVVVGLHVLTLGGGLLAMNTGEKEEETVEEVVAESAIEAHEERAEAFVWLAGISLAASAAALLIRQEKAALAATIATVLLNFGLAGATYLVGHSGGELVYVHNAGAAYSGPNAGSAAGEKGGEAGEHGDDDDE